MPGLPLTAFCVTVVSCSASVELLDQLLRNLPHEHVAALRGELALAHGELVDTAHGLYPAALEKHGLAKSLSAAAARSPVPVTVDANLDETTLPRAGALTAYYVATEAELDADPRP